MQLSKEAELEELQGYFSTQNELMSLKSWFFTVAKSKLQWFMEGYELLVYTQLSIYEAR